VSTAQLDHPPSSRSARQGDRRPDGARRRGAHRRGTTAPPRPAGPSAGLYGAASTSTGPLQEPTGAVRYRPVLGRRERVTASVLVLLNVVAGVVFVTWLAHPAHIPTGPGGSDVLAALAIVAFALLVLLELVRLLQCATLWVFTLAARDPLPVRPARGTRVAVLTTIVPGKEPLDLVVTTLAAMRRLRHDGQVDVWILDEGDDPEVRRAAARLGVRHFSRKGVPHYNQASGPFKARTKAGNHNAWRAEFEDGYDVVAQMDPDHVPLPDFLERTLGYFTDPDVAFVVAPQVYGNLRDGFVQHASATQAYFFHGIIQRGGNGLGAPLLIGTNHLYRPSAWRAAGGYQDSIIEDHLTAMAVFATSNPATGNRYRGVYTPDVLAVGEGPASWTDFFNQQKRWAYGIWEILVRHTPRLMPRLSPGQRWAFALLQSFYPSTAAVFVLGNALTLFTVVTGAATTRLDVGTYFLLWVPTVVSSLGLFLWLRRFNLVEHERREWGIAGMAMLVATIPVYVSAAITALAGRPLAYAVTAKGDLTSPDRLRTFRPHLVWAAVVLAALVTALVAPLPPAPVVGWLLVTAVSVLAPVGVHLAGRARRHRAAPPVVLVPGRPDPAAVTRAA
jgi:cellulose synthase (UDP-forming)